MKETHQPRAPTVPRTGRPNREPLDADEVIAYGLALAEDLGVSIPKHRRLRRMLKRRIPIPQIYQGADYRPVSYTHLTLPTMIIRCRSRWSPYH